MKVILILSLLLLISGCTASNITLQSNSPFTTQDYLKKANEESRVFSFNQYYESVGNGETRDILIKTNSKKIQLLEYILISGDTPQDFFIYESPTISNNGSLKQVENRNRVNNSNSSILLYESPTISNSGSLIYRDLLISGKKEAGTTMANPYNWILKEDTYYLIRTQNRAGNTEQIIKLIWVEFD